MEVLFSIIGIILSVIAAFTLIRNVIIDKLFIIKKVKVVGFDAYTYFIPSKDCSTIYHAEILPIVEIEDDNKKIKVAISTLANRSKLEKGDEIQVIYPNGNINKIRSYDKNNMCKFYYLNLIIGILLIILSI